MWNGLSPVQSGVKANMDVGALGPVVPSLGEAWPGTCRTRAVGGVLCPQPISPNPGGTSLPEPQQGPRSWISLVLQSFGSSHVQGCLPQHTCPGAWWSGGGVDRVLQVVLPATWTDGLAPCGVAGWEREMPAQPWDAEPRPLGRGFEHS